MGGARWGSSGQWPMSCVPSKPLCCPVLPWALARWGQSTYLLYGIKCTEYIHPPAPRMDTGVTPFSAGCPLCSTNGRRHPGTPALCHYPVLLLARPPGTPRRLSVTQTRPESRPASQIQHRRPGVETSPGARWEIRATDDHNANGSPSTPACCTPVPSSPIVADPDRQDERVALSKKRTPPRPQNQTLPSPAQPSFDAAHQARRLPHRHHHRRRPGSPERQKSAAPALSQPATRQLQPQRAITMHVYSVLGYALVAAAAVTLYAF